MIDLKGIQIVAATETDSEILTEIAFAAKRHWNYPEHYLEIWKEELTITTKYIEQNLVYKAQHNGVVLGFYSIVENKADFYSGEVFVKKGYWLEHMFIKPDFHKLGIGCLLFDHAKQTSKSSGIEELMIFVDPFARGFYKKMGAEYLYNSKSSIQGRMIPVYVLKIITY